MFTTSCTHWGLWAKSSNLAPSKTNSDWCVVKHPTLEFCENSIAVWQEKKTLLSVYLPTNNIYWYQEISEWPDHPKEIFVGLFYVKVTWFEIWTLPEAVIVSGEPLNLWAFVWFKSIQTLCVQFSAVLAWTVFQSIYEESVLEHYIILYLWFKEEWKALKQKWDWQL